MSPTNPFRNATLLALLISAFSISETSNATIVEIETSIGTIEVNLYDNGTPATVANFLDYVQNGAYTDSVVHRSVPGFVLQGGGFLTDMNAMISDIITNPAVANEPVYSNVRGTIAMAKLGGDPNSATSQWFFNLADNSVNLDVQNGGFTVFGEVSAASLAVLDDTAALPTFNLGGAFSNTPLRNYTATDAANGVPVDNTHLIIVTSITVTDTTPDSAGAAGLTPVPNTLINAPPPPAPPSGGGGGGGGSLGFPGLLFLALLGWRKRCLRNSTATR